MAARKFSNRGTLAFLSLVKSAQCTYEAKKAWVTSWHNGAIASIKASERCRKEVEGDEADAVVLPEDLRVAPPRSDDDLRPICSVRDFYSHVSHLFSGFFFPSFLVRKCN